MAKLWEKPCNFFNIKFWVKREKAIVQNSNSTNSIELPRCGPLRLGAITILRNHFWAYFSPPLPPVIM